MSDWTPIHEDLELTEYWFGQHGIYLSQGLFYNSIRDGGGHYDGFALDMPHGDSVYVKTIREAEIAIKWWKSQQALSTIRTAGNNTSAWAQWAQKWCAHAMRPETFPRPPADAPDEPKDKEQE